KMFYPHLKHSRPRPVALGLDPFFALHGFTTLVSWDARPGLRSAINSVLREIFPVSNQLTLLPAQATYWQLAGLCDETIRISHPGTEETGGIHRQSRRFPGFSLPKIG